MSEDDTLQGHKPGGAGLGEIPALDPYSAGNKPLGVPADLLEAIGGGFTNFGVMRYRVVIPLRTEGGTVVGYLGINPTLKDTLIKHPVIFRRDIRDNVVSFRRK